MIKVGEALKEERKKKGLTLDTVAKATRIRASFLQAIEEGRFERLPGSSYAHGFVKNYLEYMDFPIREYMALFRREYDEKEQRNLIPEGLVGKGGFPIKKFSITQAFWLGSIIIITLFFYLLFQYRAAFFPPTLTVTNPKEKAAISSTVLLVSGTTDANTAVTVNSLPAFVDQEGTFSKEIPVFQGSVTIEVKAVNSFGKMTTIDRHVTVTQSQ